MSWIKSSPPETRTGNIHAIMLCTPQRPVDHDGHDIAFIEGSQVRCVDGRKFGLYKVKA